MAQKISSIGRELSNNYNKSIEKEYLIDRVSYAKKVANDYAWVKEKIDYLDKTDIIYTEKYAKLKTNYELYNGNYEEKDFEYLMKPFGFETDIRNASFKHMDIMSEPLREIVGEEERRPFDPTVIAVNSDAVVKRREEKAKLIQQYIVQQVTNPIEQQIQQKEIETGTPMTEEEKQKMRQEMTPPEIEEFMKKKFKLPEETQGQQLLNWLIKKENLHYKFNKGWRDVIIGDREVYLVTTENKHPVVKLRNPLFFEFDKSDDIDFIQDGDWATYQSYLLLSDIYKEDGEFLTEKDRKKLDDYFSNTVSNLDKGKNITDGMLIESGGIVYDVSTMQRYIRRIHVVFKTLKKIKFIVTLTEKGIEEKIVDETYVFNPDIDLEESVAWIPEVWEGVKLGSDIYTRLRPLPNQYTNMSNPYNVKLPYYGAIYNDKNAKSVSLLDRAKAWNFMFDVAFYRLEESIGSDMGNVLLAVNKSIPKNWSPEKWLAFLKATKVALIDPNQEGAAMGSDPQYWKSLDLSNKGDISQYINLLAYCQNQCYKAIGSNESRIGSTAASDTVGNNQQKILQSATITEPLFSVHNLIKEQVCAALLEEAKLTYKGNTEAVVNVLDDMSIELLNLDTSGLSLSELGCFISNNTENYNMMQQLRNNIQALIQNSDGDLRLAAKALSTKNPAALVQMIDEKYESMQEEKQQQAQQQQEMAKAQMAEASKQAEIQRAHELKLAMIKAMGFMNDADVNKDMIPDVLQMQKFNQEFDIKLKELELREKELTENNKSEAEDRKVEREKIQAMKNKPTKTQ